MRRSWLYLLSPSSRILALAASVCAPSTSPEASVPLLVPVVCAGRSAVAVVDQIRAVAKERLEARLGIVSSDHLRAVEEGLRQILEL